MYRFLLKQRLPVVFSLRNSRRFYATEFTAVYEGTPGTLEYRAYLQRNGTRISTWHDVPLRAANGAFNFVCEIPKDTNAKLEIALKEQHTPIKQDTKNGKLRFIKYSNYPWNYGAFPQTWEDPNEINPDVNLVGDGDPLDVVEIGGVPFAIGEVVPVKPLGVLGLIDEGACDFKVISIATSHPKAASYHDIFDVDRVFLDQLAEWFRVYKTADGKPPNHFAYGVIRDKSLATKVIMDTHASWQRSYLQT